MMKAEEANGQPCLISSYSWTEAGQKHLSPTTTAKEGSHPTTNTAAVETMKPSVWEAASPPQQEQTWKESYAAKKKHEEEQIASKNNNNTNINHNESTAGAIVSNNNNNNNNSCGTSHEDDLVVPQFVVIMAWRRLCDDDAVSDLNSEADVEDEDCLPEATIQVLEALFGEIPLDGDDEDDEDEEEEDEDDKVHLDGYKSDNEESSSGEATTESSSLSEADASFDLTAATGTTTAEKENDRRDSKKEADANNLPVVTLQVLKSLFTSLDDIDLSTTTYSTTTLETS